jgi:hypothetical protein
MDEEAVVILKSMRLFDDVEGISLIEDESFAGIWWRV